MTSDKEKVGRKGHLQNLIVSVIQTNMAWHKSTPHSRLEDMNTSQLGLKITFTLTAEKNPRKRSVYMLNSQTNEKICKSITEIFRI